KDFSPWRTSTWSSASTIRIGIAILQWKSDGNFSPVARARFDLQCSADGTHALAHGHQTQPFSGRPLAASHFESRAIVPDRAALREIFSPGANPYVAGLRVFHGVRQRFLDNAVERRFRCGWQASGNNCVD